MSYEILHIQYKKMSIKNRPYYFLNDMINIKSFDPNLSRVTKLSRENDDIDDDSLVIYHIKYVTMKSFEPVINNRDSPCLIFNNVNGYIIEKSNQDKYLIIASTNQNKKVLKKYTKLWNDIKNQIETISGCKPIIDRKEFKKFGFKLDNNLPLGIILNIPSLITVIRSVFQEGNKYYSQFLLDKCLCEL